MYITNIRHLVDASERMPEAMPKDAREILGFLTSVIEFTSMNPRTTLTSSGLACFKKGCHGVVKTALRAESDEIHWYCPECENEGLISNWKDTEWDKRKTGK